MLLRLSLSLWILIGVWPIGVKCQELNSPDEIKAIERAHVATDEVRKNFKKVLSKELENNSAAKALSACRIKAPQITNKAGEGEIIGMGRASHKVRNPSNTAPEWAKPYLEKFSSSKASEIPKQTLVKISPRSYGYIEPIFVEPICLKCHGTHVAKDVSAAILKEYPEDKAVGFNVGDFRGILWLEMKTRL